MQRFAGTVKAIATVDVDALARWIVAIPFSEWHQQHPSQPNQLRPAMMTDPAWPDSSGGLQTHTAPVIADVLQHLPGCVAYWPALTVVMPGDSIRLHIDEQPTNWLGRVHVPLQADDAATFHCGGEDHTLSVGTAYLVNTLAQHGVTNRGSLPRIHFMFDLRGS